MSSLPYIGSLDSLAYHTPLLSENSSGEEHRQGGAASSDSISVQEWFQCFIMVLRSGTVQVADWAGLRCPIQDPLTVWLTLLPGLRYCLAYGNEGICREAETRLVTSFPFPFVVMRHLLVFTRALNHASQSTDRSVMRLGAFGPFGLLVLEISET